MGEWEKRGWWDDGGFSATSRVPTVPRVAGLVPTPLPQLT